MAKPVPPDGLADIESALKHLPADGATAQQIVRCLKASVPFRTLQHRLKHLVLNGRVVKMGKGRWTRYRLPNAAISHLTPMPQQARVSESSSSSIPLSPEGRSIQAYVAQSIAERTPAGYNRAFLDAYQPNVSSYLSEQVRLHLATVGRPSIGEQPAGTYAKQILHRLLIDLSWNSSRLEGNTYSLLDTTRLIELGEEAEGHAQLESQMILNHKDAIEFLVENVSDVAFNRYTILNLHALLANNLLADVAAPGRLRHIPVGVHGSVFYPLEVPQLIEDCFEQMLATAELIRDPFEQAFFVMVHLPYLQPFDDVNKRVSRLAANIPLIARNFSPLTFMDVPNNMYTQAILGVYEKNSVELLRDVFVWAYERSASRYLAVRQSLGEPNPFRLRYRTELRDVVAEIIRKVLGRADAIAHIANWAQDRINDNDLQRFNAMVENELASLHEGNFARYRVTPSQFVAWQKVWHANV